MTGARPATSGGIRRIMANLGLLLGGKVGAGAISLIYLVIAARTLGARDYGVLVLIHAYVTLVGGIIAFSGFHGLVRYGSIALEAGDHGRLLRLTRFMTLVELGFGLAAIIVAALAVPLVGPHLGWSPAAMQFALPYSLAVLATVRSTPQGLLQLAGRFDLIGAHNLVAPLVRVGGSVLVWWLGGGLIGFLAVWLVAAVAEGASMWAFGLWALARMKLDQPLLGSARGAVADNPQLVSFIATTNLDLTLAELARKLAPLAVGWVLGPRAAGIFALAQRASVVLEQPATLIGQASYPVMARQLAEGDRAGFRQSVWHSAALAMLAAAPVVVLLGLFGRSLLDLIGGGSFEGGAKLLLLLALARAVGIGAPSLSAGLIAMGRPQRSITVNLVSNLLLFPLLPALLWWRGVDGAGWHALLIALIATAALALYFRREAARAEVG